MDNPVHAVFSMALGVSLLLAALFCQGCAVGAAPTSAVVACDPAHPETCPAPVAAPTPSPDCGNSPEDDSVEIPCTDLGDGKYQCDVYNYDQQKYQVPRGTQCISHAGDTPPACTLWLYCTPIVDPEVRAPAPLAVPQCIPGAFQCDGQDISQCQDTKVWSAPLSCPYACSAGGCTGECVPGSARPGQVCDDTGVWVTTPVIVTNAQQCRPVPTITGCAVTYAIMGQVYCCDPT